MQLQLLEHRRVIKKILTRNKHRLYDIINHRTNNLTDKHKHRAVK
jgi:hypothetical protein